MPYLSSFINTLRTAGILLVVAIIAVVLNRADHNRTHSRGNYEAFLKKKTGELILQSGLTKTEPGADHPEWAAFQEYLMTMDPSTGRVPSERLKTAWQKMHSASFKSTSYQLSWQGTSVLMGGRTRAIMWDPNDITGKKVWAGSVTGGLWYNSNITSGITLWQPVSDLWPNLVISCMAYDPANPMTFYVGTGESQTALITYRESSGRGVGIWKTTDGGQSFQLLPSTASFNYITKMIVKNENGISVLYAGVVSGIYKGSIWQSQPSDGLFRSADGGNTWTQVLPDITGDDVPYAPADVQLGPGGRIFVGTVANLDGKGGGTILYSDLGTPGSWTEYTDIRTIIEMDPVNNQPYRVVIAPSASNQNIVYAAISAGTTGPSANPVYKGYYVLKSTDMGANWALINTPDGTGDWANLAWHAMDLAVDPNDPSTVYAGGLDMWRTRNSGSSWEKLSDWSLMYYGGGDDYIHADQHIIAYKPGSSSEILFGTDGGVFYTTNGNASTPIFSQKNKNYNSLQFYTCALHPAPGEDQYLGGLQDNGTLLYQGSPLSINNMISGGDGAYCFWDQDESNLYITSYYYNRYSVFNNGSQVSYIDQYSGTFINPADYDDQRNTLYANAVDLWGGNANKILRVSDIPQNGNGSFINTGTSVNTYFSAVKVSPHSTMNSTNLFLGTASGQLFYLTNAQANPQFSEIGSPDFPTANISCIEIGGSDDTLLVTFSNYGVSSIWQSCNRGVNWREVEGDLPDMPVRWAVYHPQNPNQAMIATELGVWTTSSLQKDIVYWQPQTNGMANVRVDMLKLRQSDLTVLAASHGRGLFTTTFSYDLTTGIHHNESSSWSVSPNSRNHFLSVQCPVSHSNAELSIYSLNGVLLWESEIPSGKTNHDIELPFEARGAFLVEIKENHHRRYAGKFVIW